MHAPRTNRAVALWLFAVTLLVIAMVGLGGFTRLSHAGLSIVEWNPVMGALPPLGAQAWNEAFAAYAASPEGRLVNSSLDLEGFKTIFFIEWAHRLLGRLIGVAFALPWLFFLWRRRITGRQAVGLLSWFGLGGLQGALGWCMVQSGLVDIPHVSPFRLTAHLLLALLVASGLWWQTLRWSAPRPAPRGPNWPARVLLTLAVATVAWGGLMAGHKAGIVSDTFPLMFGQWVPPAFWADTFGWANPFLNPVAVHFLHRVLGVTTFVFSAVAVVRYRRGSLFAFRAALATFSLAMVQVLLGLVTIWLHVPMAIAVAHQVTGVLVALAAVALVYGASARRRAAAQANSAPRALEAAALGAGTP
jgi:cytochrome c oxidase assembly protein subunit 15